MGNGHKQKKKQKKNQSKNSKAAKPGSEQEAVDYVANWVNCCQLDAHSPMQQNPPLPLASAALPIVDLHAHSTFSDGMLTPTQLVERCARRGVRVLALTDHDTMAGVQEAMIAGAKYKVRVIPGVEISAKVGSLRKLVDVCRDGGRLNDEPVHILAYYGYAGPSDSKTLEESLEKVRERRFRRVRTMVEKLQYLNKPVTWERVMELVGEGGVPGRPHVARALMEAGHVLSLQEAFRRYLNDGGPAYASGDESPAEDVVQLICCTGGFATLAHPWTLKDPRPLVRRLKAVGLHAIEAYRSTGKVFEFIQMAEEFNLVKLGGSDYHGTKVPNEIDVGAVPIPAKVLCEFLKLAQPIWSKTSVV